LIKETFLICDGGQIFQFRAIQFVGQRIPESADSSVFYGRAAHVFFKISLVGF
jgi:hypothetical protein